jgi:hypothetical protein
MYIRFVSFYLESIRNMTRDIYDDGIKLSLLTLFLSNVQVREIKCSPFFFSTFFYGVSCSLKGGSPSSEEARMTLLKSPLSESDGVTVAKLSEITPGSRRIRSLLFKYLSERINVPSRLTRYQQNVELLYNTVKCKSIFLLGSLFHTFSLSALPLKVNGEEFIVDLIQPFKLYSIHSESAKRYIQGNYEG